MKTVLSHANLIDCVEPKVRPDCAVLIEDGRIRAILPSGEAGSAGDAQMIDLKGGFLMPGLWDVHIHPDYLSLDEMPLADQVTLFGHRLATALTESGIVGLRCAGAHNFMDVAWKRAFDSGQHVGPRLFASGYFLTTTGGHFLTSGHALDDECIALLLEHETWYVPTLAISHLTASQATNRFEAAWVAHRGLSHALCCRAEAASDVHATWFRKALDAGVRMALGSDIRPLKD